MNEEIGRLLIEAKKLKALWDAWSDKKCYKEKEKERECKALYQENLEKFKIDGSLAEENISVLLKGMANRNYRNSYKEDVIKKIMKSLYNVLSKEIDLMQEDHLEEKIVVGEIIGMLLTVQGVTKTQLRKFLDFFSIKKPLVLLKPKLAYETGRKKELWILKDIIDPYLEKNENWDKVKGFIEAIVAYHRFYGGKD